MLCDHRENEIRGHERATSAPPILPQTAQTGVVVTPDTFLWGNAAVPACSFSEELFHCAGIDLSSGLANAFSEKRASPDKHL